MTELELVAFLRARLDEAEQLARANAGDERHQQWAMHESADYNEGVIVANALWRLRDVDAKRRIIGEFERREAWLRMGTLVEPARSEATAKRDALVPVLRMLALPDAEHPDYRQEWTP